MIPFGADVLWTLAYRAFRPALFALDPETAHEWTFAVLRRVEALLCRAGTVPAPARYPALAQRIAGISFPNPVGLAAGLDKNAEVPHVWALLGFGFAELGTVTAKPQEGNPKPRLWRFPQQRALVNRMGFNNLGARTIAESLAQKLARLRSPIPLGINIGKSRSAPARDAPDDYAETFQLVAPLADYVCINVSSPNTPGLRELQNPAQLARLLERLQAENRRGVESGTLPSPRPLFVKVAPDLSEADAAGIADVVRGSEVAALVATNTTTDRTALGSSSALVEGGLSGAPLRALSTALVRRFFRLLEGQVPIVGVGGIFSADDAYEKFLAGASLVQVYTGLVYEGPGIAGAICRGVVERLEREGVRHLSEIVGRNA
jgi:dihydroorotate dehydrogenase